MQEAGTSRAGAGTPYPHAETSAPMVRPGSGLGRPPLPEARTTRNANRIALKDGEAIPEGYAVVVETRGEQVPSPRNPQKTGSENVDFITQPKVPEHGGAEALETEKSKAAARRNMARNTNRRLNATFAKELKESLATGEPMTVKVAEDHNDLKGPWHAAAKEVAYKFLDLTKESWKDYSVFEKSVVHNEINEQYKFDPPIGPKTIDNYLSCHLRTSRAVWKAHWKKNGPAERHHNCPQVAWDKLCKWWPTSACKEQAAVMASRRARVEKNSKVGRSSLVHRMDEQVSCPHMLASL
jgi:hypothetical protein